MKTLKRSASLILAVVLSALLCVPALAVDTHISTQSVKVDGKSVSVQPYFIAGNNYFKLRDVAALLNGTGSQFEVSYSSSAKRMYVYTDKAYTSVGGELQIATTGAKSCSVSQWALSVDGKAVTCSVYIINGNNYFKLRDLGDAVGFGVDYDSATSTVLVTTKNDSYKPDITFSTTDLTGAAWTDACFKNAKLTMINYWAYWCGPCVNEMPDLQKLADNYASKGVQIIGICDGGGSSLDRNKTAYNDMSLTYPCIVYTSAFDDYLQSGYMPTTIFVDGNGKVVGQQYIGSMSYGDWAKVIDSLLK